MNARASTFRSLQDYSVIVLVAMAFKAPNEVLRLIRASSPYIINKLIKPKPTALQALLHIMIVARIQGDSRSQSIIAAHLHVGDTWNRVRTLLFDKQKLALQRVICRFVSEMARLNDPRLQRCLVDCGAVEDLCHIFYTNTSMARAACEAIAVVICSCVGFRGRYCIGRRYLNDIISLASYELKHTKMYPIATLLAIDILKDSSIIGWHNIFEHLAPLSKLSYTVAQGMLVAAIHTSLGSTRDAYDGNVCHFGHERDHMTCLHSEKVLIHLPWLAFCNDETISLLAARVVLNVLEAVQDSSRRRTNASKSVLEQGWAPIIWLTVHDPAILLRQFRGPDVMTLIGSIVENVCSSGSLSFRTWSANPPAVYQGSQSPTKCLYFKLKTSL